MTTNPDLFSDKGNGAEQGVSTPTSPQFTVHLPVFIDIKQTGGTTRVRSEVVGWREKEFLVIRTPENEGHKVMHRQGKGVVVRYLRSGSVFGFVTELLAIHRSPLADLWFLKFPKVAESKNLRRSPRMNTFLDAVGPNGAAWKVINLSSIGALVCADQAEPLGSELNLSFRLPNNSEIENIRAIVRRVDATKGGMMLGLEFHPEETEKHNLVGQYVDGYLAVHDAA